jgi:hypothetical protein
MSQILTRVDLDQAACGTPGCDHTAHGGGLVFHSQCHPSRPTWASYQSGVLTFRCSKCDQLIVQIAVAERPPVPFDPSDPSVH